MAKLIKNDHTVTTNYAPEIVTLRSQGYVDVPAEKPAERPATNGTPEGDTHRAAAKSSK